MRSSSPRVRHVPTRRATSTSEVSRTPFFKTEKLKNLWAQYDRKNLGTRILGGLLLLFALGGFIFWAIFLRGMPSIDELAKGNFFRESTTIYDRDGGEIYSLFKDGRRTYVNYDQISQSIKDAIISTEDRTFFENPGIDFLGLMRAGAKYLMGSNDSVKGTSTISQQLIRNTLLTNERSIKRKAQEMFLSYRLNGKYSKEKILEMYLNAFSFGYNANGVEEASQTYFGKSAADVGPLGASILASLPKGPTYYSPYLHRDRLMGKLEVFPAEDATTRKMLSTPDDRKTYATLYNNFRSYLSGMTLERTNVGLHVCNAKQEYVKGNMFSIDRKGCVDLKFSQVLDFFGNINIAGNVSTGDGSGQYVIEYTIGRKDFVAAQMLEDGKIDAATFHKILYDGIEFEFKKYAENIKHPYFVMYVKEYLESKYGKDIDVTSGLKVYTTIDPKLQTFAEEAVKKQADINKKQFGATSAALVSMDNVTGDLLAMVGGPDYFDTENGGNNNMAISEKTQPGSSFKPIVYALAISKNPIGPASPVADVDTSFGKWNPDNYDGRFNGMMSVETALDYSRNIPAIKMYYLAGQEAAIVKHGKALGINSLKDNASYGAPLAIGSAEARPVEMLQAYSVLANNGVKKKLHFISRILDSDGNVIEENKDNPGEEVFSPAASYIISTILSNEDARPSSTFWRSALSIPGRKVAAKTGTSNKPGKNHSAILPKDLWTIGYTPQITTVVWAGNVDGSATKGSCDGLNCAAPIWKSFMTFALKDLPKVDFKRPDGVYDYTISKLTGLLATKNTPSDLARKTIMAVKLEASDEGVASSEVDTLCNGPVTDETPPDARKTLYRPTGKPIIDGYDPGWYQGFLSASKTSSASGSAMSTEPCFRPKSAGTVGVSASRAGNTVTVSWNGNRIIDRVIMTQGGEVLEEFQLPEGSGSTVGSRSINVSGGDTVVVEVVDVYGYRYSSSTNGSVSPDNTGGTTLPTPETNNPKDAPAPTIGLINPRGGAISLRSGDVFNLRFRATIGTSTREVSVSVDGKEIQSATSGDNFVFPVSTSGLNEGLHTLVISVKDANFKTTSKSVSINIIP